MLRKKSLCGGIIPFFVIFVLCSFAFAQDQKYKDYTIQKGDTLWDITEHHRGKIWLESTVGQGTTFYFTMPK